MESSSSSLEDPHRHVHAEKRGVTTVGEKSLEQPSLTAAEVYDPRRPDVGQSDEERLSPKVVQFERSLQGRLDNLALRLPTVRIEIVIIRQSAQRFSCQSAPIVQVAAGDDLDLRMEPQPLAAPIEQFLHLIVPDPVVLLAVESRDQHRQVCKDVGKPLGRL